MKNTACAAWYGSPTPAQAGLTIPEISQAEGVSPAYAAKILRVLRKGGFVKAARGKEGGYTLARPAEDIVIGNVMDALGGRLVRKRFLRQPFRPSSHLHALGGLLRALAVARRAGGRGPGPQQGHPARPAAERRGDELLGPHHSGSKRATVDVAATQKHRTLGAGGRCGADALSRRQPMRRRDCGAGWQPADRLPNRSRRAPLARRGVALAILSPVSGFREFCCPAASSRTGRYPTGTIFIITGGPRAMPVSSAKR